MNLGLIRIITAGFKLWDWLRLFSKTLLPLLFCLFPAYRMAGHARLPRPWLAFLPLGGYFYIMGKLAEPSGFHRTGRNRWPSLWYPVWSTALFLSFALMQVAHRYLITGVFLVSLAATVVINAYVLYSILWDRLRKDVGLYTFLGLVLPITRGIFFFLVMDLVPRSVTGKKQYLDGQPRYDKNHQWSPPPPKRSTKPKKNP